MFLQGKCKIVSKMFLTFKYSCEFLLHYKTCVPKRNHTVTALQIRSESQFEKNLVVNNWGKWLKWLSLTQRATYFTNRLHKNIYLCVCGSLWVYLCLKDQCLYKWKMRQAKPLISLERKKEVYTRGCKEHGINKWSAIYVCKEHRISKCSSRDKWLSPETQTWHMLEDLCSTLNTSHLCNTHLVNASHYILNLLKSGQHLVK